MRYLVILIVSLGLVSGVSAEEYDLAANKANSGPKGPVGKLPKDIQEQVREAFELAKKKGPRFSLIGPLQVGKKAKYSVNGTDFDLDRDALILGDLVVGQKVSVRGKVVSGARIATQVHTEAYNSNKEEEEEGGSYDQPLD